MIIVIMIIMFPVVNKVVYHDDLWWWWWSPSPVIYMLCPFKKQANKQINKNSWNGVIWLLMAAFDACNWLLPLHQIPCVNMTFVVTTKAQTVAQNLPPIWLTWNHYIPLNTNDQHYRNASFSIAICWVCWTIFKSEKFVHCEFSYPERRGGELKIIRPFFHWHNPVFVLV